MEIEVDETQRCRNQDHRQSEHIDQLIPACSFHGGPLTNRKASKGFSAEAI
jgi:hypothetical protein